MPRVAVSLQGAPALPHACFHVSDLVPVTHSPRLWLSLCLSLCLCPWEPGMRVLTLGWEKKPLNPSLDCASRQPWPWASKPGPWFRPCNSPGVVSEILKIKIIRSFKDYKFLYKHELFFLVLSLLIMSYAYLGLDGRKVHMLRYGEVTLAYAWFAWSYVN